MGDNMTMDICTLNVRILASHSGRLAIVARKEPGAAWVQVESCTSEAQAEAYIQMYNLDGDAKVRSQEIDDAEDASFWGQHAPITPPTD